MADVLTSVSPTDAGFSSTHIEQVFAQCFSSDYKVCLQGGAKEPLYTPARDNKMATLYYRYDYFASALHEVAHWCIAGKERRELTDFGYWYAEDGRGREQQEAFESVEFKPQALEWYFARACGWRFQISLDNLDTVSGSLPDARTFCQRVVRQAELWSVRGLPERGEMFYRALSKAYGTVSSSRQQAFSVEEIL